VVEVVDKETKIPSQHEQAVDVEQFGNIAHERHEAMRNALEQAERKHNKSSHQSEREVLARAQELAKETEKDSHDEHSTSPPEKRRGPITKKQLGASFKSQMKYAENEMSKTERVVSRIIHSAPIEKTSEFIGTTVARPNAMLSGSIAAFGGITICYFISKYYGFQLSGFETIGAFILGWIVGLLYDYFSVMIRGHRK
jgi:hypothetical protein